MAEDGAMRKSAVVKAEADEAGLLWIAIDNPKPGAGYTVTLAAEGMEPQVLLEAYELHLHVENIDGGDFERPKVKEVLGDWPEDPDEDGDTLFDDPYEVHPDHKSY